MSLTLWPLCPVCHRQRFELNYETFMREKVNDRFEFPQTLDLYPYSTEGVAWKQRHDAKVAAAAAATPKPEPGADDADDATPVVADVGEPRPYEAHPKEYYEYELVGVVVHMGTADSGHYYSLIRERGDGPSDASAAGCVPTSRDGSLALESTAAHALLKSEAARASHRGEWFEFNDSMVQVRRRGTWLGFRSADLCTSSWPCCVVRVAL